MVLIMLVKVKGVASFLSLALISVLCMLNVPPPLQRREGYFSTITQQQVRVTSAICVLSLLEHSMSSQKTL